MTSRFAGWRERAAAYKSGESEAVPLLGWRNFQTLHNINMYKNVSIVNRAPNILRKTFNLEPDENPNAWANWANNNNSKAKIARIIASGKYPLAKNRASLYTLYLHNLAYHPTRVAARNERNKAEARLLKYENKGNLPPIKKFKLKTDGTWEEVNYNYQTVFHRVTNNHLKKFPYLRQLVIRKNSPRLKGLPMRNNWHYIPRENMRNFSNVKKAVTRQRQTRGEAAALAKLGEVYNRIRQRQHARNRGKAFGEFLKNMWNLKHGRSIVPPGVNMSKKTKANSPNKLQRTNSTNKKLENVRKEHSRLVAEAAAAARRNVSAHNAGTWTRTASGGFKLKKN